VATAPDLATAFETIDLTGGVRVMLIRTASGRVERSPELRESARFLHLADRVLDLFRPDMMLTSGGHISCLELMRGARMKSVAVVFRLPQPWLQRSQGPCRPREADGGKPEPSKEGAPGGLNRASGFPFLL
jgi:hypothetical protein